MHCRPITATSESPYGWLRRYHNFGLARIEADQQLAALAFDALGLDFW
nr:hypothetical protein REQ54_04356 [Rhizobium sp. Q54]